MLTLTKLFFIFVWFFVISYFYFVLFIYFCFLFFRFRELAKSAKFIMLTFVNPDIERAYLQHTESISSVTPQAFLIVRFAVGISQLVVLPRYVQFFTTCTIPLTMYVRMYLLTLYSISHYLSFTLLFSH